ncbi:hypothetical protein GF406_10980 [candidate division KSB1 bacterium]|nr:hypothetical protein [candidate division KSB1 bacterium]
MRNNPTLKKVDPFAPLSVGNGDFAFTADITGLQTFPDYYFENGIPLETQAQWAWHSFPNPNNYVLSDANDIYDVHGREVGFPTRERSPAGQWLRLNPHRLPLVQIGFDLKKSDGTVIRVEDIQGVHQQLNMWTGVLQSSFTIDGERVNVETLCHPDIDMIAVHVESPLLAEGRLGVNIRFPYTHDPKVKNKPSVDWSHPDSHTTTVLSQQQNSIRLQRDLDDTRFYVDLEWSDGGKIRETARHSYLLSALNEARLSFSCGFFQTESTVLADFNTTKSASAQAWQTFWTRGGIIDFGHCKDPRAKELERRVVLSQYLTRIQYAGSMPPAETGLTHSSWFGKHNTEMYWWHAAHFPLWGRPELLENSMPWYQSILPHARETAQKRGYKGARWSKMVGPDGRESPGGNPLIIWNQPHLIYQAELIYRANPVQEILEKYEELVFETAECMADYAYWEENNQRYVLGPPLWIAQEIYNPRQSQNPTFELEYWVFGLELAQEWRSRLGLDLDRKWDHVIKHMSPLPVKDSLYVALESNPDTFDNLESRRDHPTMLAPLGILPGKRVDRTIMHNTFNRVLETWDWEAKIWGWDYPMIAMTATRLGEPEKAIEILLMDAPNNHYTANGHCPQRQDLAVYLPANGSLLSALALMTAGWEGAPQDTPGFPKDGNWDVRWEGLFPLP